MNHRLAGHRHSCIRRTVAAALLVSACFAGTAGAQLSSSVRSDPDTTSNNAAINQFVGDEVAALADPATVAGARAKLLAELGGSPSPSDAFLRAYGSALAGPLNAAISGDNTLAKINAAIVLHEAATKSRSGDLLEPVLTAVKSDNQAIAIHGIRAAEGVLPVLLATMVRQPDGVLLVEELVSATERFSDEPAILLAVHESLQVGMVNGPQGLNGSNELRAAVPLLVDGVLELVEARLPEFVDGLPDTAEPELTATMFLTDKDVVRNLGDREQRVAQALADLLVLAQKQNLIPENAAERGRINTLIDNVGGGFFPFSSFVAQPAKLNEARESAKTLASNVRSQTPPSQVQPLVDALIGDLSTAYPDLRVPGELPAGE